MHTQVDVINRSDSVDLANYMFNGEWELITVVVRRNEISDVLEDNKFP